MTRTVLTLPPEQAAQLSAAYNEAVAAKRRSLVLGAAVVIGLVLLSAWQAQVDLGVIWDKLGNFTSFITRIFRFGQRGDGPPVWTDVGEWFWGIRKWLRLLGETLLMAYVSTFLAAIIAFFLCFVSAENLMRIGWLRLTARRFLEFCRTVPDLVYALIFVVAFKLGAVPGVLAITLHTIGALGKQFADVVENIDMKPVEGVTSTGASWAQSIRFAVVPQVLSNFASYTLLRFEVNVRSAGVVGLVGAGGIGQETMISIRTFQWTDISALLIIIVLTVVVIDLITGELRRGLLNAEARR